LSQSPKKIASAPNTPNTNISPNKTKTPPNTYPMRSSPRINSAVGRFYGNENISAWEDDNNESLSLKKQISFISSQNTEGEVLKKDEYDIDYDKGKLKKMKKKKVFRKTNLFQKNQNWSSRVHKKHRNVI